MIISAKKYEKNYIIFASLSRDVRIRGQGGNRTCQIMADQSERTDYAHHITTPFPPPDFQTFLRPQ